MSKSTRGIYVDPSPKPRARRSLTSKQREALERGREKAIRENIYRKMARINQASTGKYDMDFVRSYESNIQNLRIDDPSLSWKKAAMKVMRDDWRFGGLGTREGNYKYQILNEIQSNPRQYQKIYTILANANKLKNDSFGRHVSGEFIVNSDWVLNDNILSYDLGQSGKIKLSINTESFGSDSYDWIIVDTSEVNPSLLEENQMADRRVKQLENLEKARAKKQFYSYF